VIDVWPSPPPAPARRRPSLMDVYDNQDLRWDANSSPPHH
jgi:hypothetical protein